MQRRIFFGWIRSSVPSPLRLPQLRLSWPGLQNVLEDVLARAAVTVGDSNDEYLTREPIDTRHQNLFDQEIKNGERRTKELSHNVENFQFLKTALLFDMLSSGHHSD